jgi:integrase
MANSISILEASSTLPAGLADAVKDYMTAARAPETNRAYGRAWAAFEAWCSEQGLPALPASPTTVAAWMAALASGAGGRRPLVRASINQALSAVIRRHHLAGEALDRKHPIIAEMWRGISRTKARTETIRQAQPITAGELRTMITDIGTAANRLPADARDAALLALGWACALRRSELVGLDWERTGSGSGTLRIDERGLVVTLNTSKGSQTEAATVVVPCPDMPAACAAVKVWASRASLKPGEPVFRRIDKGQRIAAGRLTDRSVARIVKARVRALALAAGKSEAEADAVAERMSGHSLRAGYATAAAAANVPSYRIQQHTRHKSAEMVSRYVREADKWTKSGLKGVGF